MNIDIFKQILDEVGKHYGINLEPDANYSCVILIRNQIKIQLELDRTQQFLIVGAPLGELPPGKFRELFLKEALRANGAPYPRFGSFGFSQRRNNLILFEKLDIQILTSTLIDFLTAFTEKALLWQESIKSGQPPQIQYYSQKSSPKGMFGL